MTRKSTCINLAEKYTSSNAEKFEVDRWMILPGYVLLDYYFFFQSCILCFENNIFGAIPFYKARNVVNVRSGTNMKYFNSSRQHNVRIQSARDCFYVLFI